MTETKQTWMLSYLASVPHSSGVTSHELRRECPHGAPNPAGVWTAWLMHPLEANALIERVGRRNPILWRITEPGHVAISREEST